MTSDATITSLAYRCPGCGFGFFTGSRTFPTTQKPAPVLTCPACRGTAILIERSDIYTVDEYIKLRRKIIALTDRRQAEARL